MDKISVAMAFALAFLAGAIAVFLVAGALGQMLATSELPPRWRQGLAGFGLLALAAIDLLAIRRATYCPIGWRRQTPRVLLRRHPLRVVAAVWGFDTGLAVTTFRVSALTWGALLLAVLGIAPAWAGLGYGLGFTVPFMFLLGRHRVGRCSRADVPADPGLESLLGRRALLQGASAVALTAGAGILVLA